MARMQPLPLAGRACPPGRPARSATPMPMPDASAAREPARTTPGCWPGSPVHRPARSEEHTSELQSLMRISYAVFCLKKKTQPPYTRCTHADMIHKNNHYEHFLNNE